MKIGIITFQCSHNYGAMLQAYGLKEYLIGLGNDVHIVNYRPRYKINMYRKFNPRYWLSRNPYKCLLRFLTELIVKSIRIKRWYAFENFAKSYFNLYSYSKDDDFSSFDVIVLGSDQIWNPKLTGGNFDNVYFGTGSKCPVISYAASSRAVGLSESEKLFFMNQFKKMSSISVREISFANLLQPLTDKKIDVVLDPVLLAGKEVFDKISVNPNVEKYVLVYQIDRRVETRVLANYIAKQLCYDVLEIVSSPIFPQKGMVQVASPSEFIGYIKNAAYVVTTSFHGLALSILYNKQFYTLDQNCNANIRLTSLLDELNLMDRFIGIGMKPSITNIDYEKVNKKLSVELIKSQQYINKALNICDNVCVNN